MSLKNNNTTKDQFTLDCTVIRFEDRYAVLKNSDPNLKDFLWPINKLPEKINIGDRILLKISDQNTEKEAEYERMRKLLEELVN